jgi:hypothetical protein
MVRQPRTTAAAVITLALAASFASTAAADPAPLNQAEAAIAAAHDGVPARPNPDEQTAGSLSRSPQLTQKQVKAIADLQSAAAQTGLHPGVFGPNPPQASNFATGAAQSTSSTNRGFDWGDAGIGAGASLLLLGIGLAGLRAATNRRTRRIREKRAMAAG